MTKQTTRRLTYHTDPSHGWIEVNRADLDALDIAHKITAYSYERGPRVFLEEDQDAATYLDAAKAAGWRVTMSEIYSPESMVRTFNHYQPRITPAALINAAQRIGKLHVIHVSN